MAPAREGADGAPVVRRDGTGERRGGGDDSFFTPRAALLFAVLMVGALFWEEALEVRARAREVVFGERAVAPTFLAPRRAGVIVSGNEHDVDVDGAGTIVVSLPSGTPTDGTSFLDRGGEDKRRAAVTPKTETTALYAPGALLPLPPVPDEIGGTYRSLGKVRGLDGVPDVTKDASAVADAAKRRAHGGEIIILMANSAGCHLAANAIANLRSVGIEHYLLVTNTKETCEWMKKKSRSGGETAGWELECGWTSFLKGHPRLKTYGLLAEERADPFRLWWARFHLLERFVDLGLNAMYVDTDVSFRVNPYVLLKGPFREFHLIGQDETGGVDGVNIGFVYCQNCVRNGPSHRVLNETVQRMLQILEHEPGPVLRWDGQPALGAKEHLWDQHIYNDVLESAVFSRDLRRRSGQRLIDPNGKHRDEWLGSPVQNFPKPSDKRWDEFEVEVAASDVPVTKNGDKMILDPGVKKAKGKVLHCVGLDVPGYDADAKKENKTSTPTLTTPSACVTQEKFLASPPWFLAGWSGVAGDETYQGVLGRWNLDPPIVAVAHLVGALAKLQTLKQLGWWQYGAEAFKPPEVVGLSEIEKRLDRVGGLGVRNMVAASRRASGDVGAGVGEYGEQVARLVTLAVAIGRRPVVPEIECGAPWVGSDAKAFLRVKDRERVVLGTRCLAHGALVGDSEGVREASELDLGDTQKIAPGFLSCCASVNFACDEGVIWQVDLDSDPRLGGMRDDVEVLEVGRLPRTKGGGIDANATAAMFENNAQKKLLIVDVANANSPGVLPTVDNLSEEMRERVDLFFKTCDHLDCRPPKRPFPRDVDPCRAPR